MGGEDEDDETLETTDFNWSDETTFLQPSIPVLKPVTFKMTSPSNQSIQIEDQVSRTALKLSHVIEQHILKVEGTLEDKKQNCSLQADVESLQKSVIGIEETIQQLSNEELDSQSALVQFTLKSIEDLEKDAISLEARLQSSSSDSDVDFKTLSASLTGCRTQLVTLHTQAQSLSAKIERVVVERRKRITEIKRYQSLLIDLEQWLGEAQATLTTEIRLTSVQIVRDQIRASESLEKDLKARSHQLEHLLQEVSQFAGFTDVEPLVTDMQSNLGSLHSVMEDAHHCLQSRLRSLQVH